VYRAVLPRPIPAHTSGLACTADFRHRRFADYDLGVHVPLNPDIGMDVDPVGWMDANAIDPRQEIWRRAYSYEGDVDGKHYDPVLVEPTTARVSRTTRG